MNEPGAEALAGRLEAIRSRVARAAEGVGRDPASIEILAVTKGQPVEAVVLAANLGLRAVGESRVQEAQAKSAAYHGPALSWHMIGHLQRNKARTAAPLFDTVHSVDSTAVGSALARHRPANATPLRVFVEVELTGLPGRAGVAPLDAPALLAELRGMPRLEVAGLMTIAPPGPAEAAAECFGRLRDLRELLARRHEITVAGLSMGMSGDFEVAIAHGATLIRLGRVLFGDPPSAQA